MYSSKDRYLYVGNNSIVVPGLYNVGNRLGENRELLATDGINATGIQLVSLLILP